jgi:hypothetical protein
MTTRRKALITALAVIVFAAMAFSIASLVTGCGRDGSTGARARDFSGYWRLSPPTDSPARLVHIQKAGSAYSVAGLGLYPIFTAVVVGDKLVWGPARVANDGRLEFSQQGSNALTGNTYGSKTDNTPVQAPFHLIRASGSESQLHEEWIRIAAHYTNPSVRVIFRGLADSLRRWAKTHRGRYPNVNALAPDGKFSRWDDSWPKFYKNPITGYRVQLSDQPGDFSYSTSNGLRSFTLTAHLIDGSDYVLHSRP